DVVAINQDRLVKRWNHQEECRALAKGDPVFIGDLLVTGNDSRTQIMLLDGALLVLGQESQVSLNEFVYDYEFDGENRLSFDLGPGFFRYVSGGIVERNPLAFELDTPLGLIGIRGTEVLANNHGPDNPCGPMAAQLAALFADPESMSMQQKHAAREVLAQQLPILRQALFGVSHETIAHIHGVANTPIYYTFDLTGQWLALDIGYEITVVRDQGPGSMTPVSEDTLRNGASSRPDWNLEVPGPLRSTQGGADSTGSSGHGGNFRSLGDPPSSGRGSTQHP
ncbi:MAG: hypothetical protein D6E12_02685, partial [Desulfovibrio sp.]